MCKQDLRRFGLAGWLYGHEVCSPVQNLVQTAFPANIWLATGLLYNYNEGTQNTCYSKELSDNIAMNVSE